MYTFSPGIRRTFLYVGASKFWNGFSMRNGQKKRSAMY